MYAVSLQLLQHLGFFVGAELGVVVLGQSARFHNGLLLLFGQLGPGQVGDDDLDRAQRMAVQHQVGSHFGEGVGAVVGDGLFGRIHHAGLQRAVQLGEGNNGGVGTQVGDHAGHDGVFGNADLHFLQVVNGFHFVAEEEMTEAFFAVADAAQGQAHGLGLGQEFLSQLAVGEIPEMLAADEGVGDGQQLGFVAAVGGELERGETADVHGTAAAENAVQHLRFGAEHAGVLDVDQHAAAGQLFHFFFEELSGFADDGIQRVHFAVGQGNGVRRQRGGAAEN